MVILITAGVKWNQWGRGLDGLEDWTD